MAMEEGKPPVSLEAQGVQTIPPNKPPALSELPRLEIPPLNNPKPVQLRGPENTQIESSPQFPGSPSRSWPPMSGNENVTVPAPSVGKRLKTVRPPEPISKEIPKPKTASSNGLPVSSISSKRTIKYATGKLGRVELVPQPSDDPKDPLNWPAWRKNLNLFALLYMVAIVGVMKTLLISVNSSISMTNNVSYTAAVTLTAVPLMVSAWAGMACVVVSKMYGKRPVYLVSTGAIFIGLIWSMYVQNSFSQHMAARVFQGLGWGAFDTLVLGSLQDTFFEHELDLPIMALHIISVASTWGAPLLGGVASATSDGFTLQAEILSWFMVVGAWLILFGVPETSFEQGTSFVNSDVKSLSHQSWPYTKFSKEAAKAYLAMMKPWSYRAPEINSALLVQAPRAAVAPTTLLLFAVTFLPYGTLWCLTSSLSMFFSVVPFMLSTANIGVLLLGPFFLGSSVAIAVSLQLYRTRFGPVLHGSTLAVATVVATVGTLGFGCYVGGSMIHEVEAGARLSLLNGTSLSFPAVSFLLGLLASGSLAYEGTVRPMIARSTSFTSTNVVIGLRNTVDMSASLVCLRNFFAGVFIIGIPNAMWMWDGLKSATIGLGVSQIFVAAAVAVVWWRYEENVRWLDGRIMGLNNLSGLKSQSSFFDFS